MLIFFNDTQYYVDKTLFSLVANTAEMLEKMEGLSINLIICDNETIRKYNYEYRGIDAATDVLSFPTIDFQGKTISECSKNILLNNYDVESRTYFIGDSIISFERAEQQAKEYGHSLKRELAFLLCHSILHLFGYDHIEREGAIIMENKQEKILNKIKILRNQEGTVSDKTLVELAIKSMEMSYSPYSKFPVGACLLGKDGSLFTGCNVENAAYGSTICAERTAVLKAVSEGVREFDAIAIAGTGIKPYPCGACRQFLNEFSPDIRILVTDEKGNYDETSLSILLPHGFGPKDVNRG